MKDYQAQFAKYEAFWNRENTDRCVLNFTAPKVGASPFRKPKNLEQKWTDGDYVLDAFRHYRENTAFVAEAVPTLFTNLGPGCLSACIGGNYDLAEGTVWMDRRPIIDDWGKLPSIEFDESSEMWQFVVNLQRKFMTDPSVYFTMTDLGGILDVLASLRSSEALLYDLYDDPEAVKDLSARITQMWLTALDQQLDTVRKAGIPYDTWLKIPSAKTWYPLQCDFCYMISPSHFEEFVLPDVLEQARHIERPVWHLDGVGELAHLDMILDIPGLAGIQWAPGAGQAPEWDEKWFPIYRKIQDKKVNLILRRGASEKDPKGMERLIKTIDPAGTYISAVFSCEEKAVEMAENIERWSK